MMKWIFSGFVISSVLIGILLGRMDEVTSAALSSCGDAVTLTITLTGSMCLWSGLMKIADKSRLTEKLSRMLSPLIGLIFEGLDHKGKAVKAIALNMSANLLGLGNAATPLGIAAMREMEKLNPNKGTATNNMAMFVVINTASLQLIPTTTAILRQDAGSVSPLDIMPAVWASSVFSVTAGIITAKLLSGKKTRP